MKPGRETYAEGRAKYLRPRAALIMCSVVVILAFLFVPAAGGQPVGAADQISSALGAPMAGADGRTIFDWFCVPSWADVVAGAGANGDAAMDVVMTRGDVTFVGGYRVNAAGNPDATLAKYKAGVRQWIVDYDGPTHSGDQCMRIALSPDGKYVYLAGVSTNAANADVMLLKRSTSTGALKWARRYDGPAHKVDVAYALGVDAYGNVVVSGFSQSATDQDVLAVSWSSSGARRWVWRYKGSGTSVEMSPDLVVSSDGTTYVGGFSASPGGITGIMARLSRRGSKLWLKKYNGPAGTGAQIVALAQRPGGGVYAAGMTLSAATGADGLVLRYSPTGKRKVLPFEMAGGGATTQVFNDVAVTSTRQVVAVGVSDASGNQDCLASVYARDESAVNSITLPGPENDYFEAVATDKLGGWYATGTHHPAPGDCRILTVRGSVLTGGGGFYSQWGGVVSLSNMPQRIAARGTSACVVGHVDAGPATGVDQAVLTFTY